MNLFSTEITNSSIQWVWVAGIAVTILLIVIKLIFKSIKRMLVIMAIIAALAYFYLIFIAK